jgi:Cu/Zn superoxide dismutase
MNLTRAALAALAVMAIATPALATPNAMHDMHNAMSSTVLNINMGQQNGSKQDGTATVKDVSGGVWVKVSVKNQPKGSSEPAHIHEGTCAKLNPAPWKPLNNVVDGTSTTTVKGITVAELKKAHYAINVHKSASDIQTYVSCGDL